MHFSPTSEALEMEKMNAQHEIGISDMISVCTKIFVTGGYIFV